ncbi:VOC family protein [Streptomyces celluloflavus]|nr:VOC family protein [Streptomyces kasugaensis]WSK14379.1 VOC family protein [Streptomyces celluloflavus]
MAAYAEGAPCWADVMLPDLGKGKRFYGELFGWTFSEGAPEFGGYTQAFRNGKRAAGLMPRENASMPTAWGLYFATDDIRRTDAAICEAGGRIFAEPMRLGDLGSMLIAVDPAGAVFGAWQAGTHQGFETAQEPGGYLWMALHTRHPDASDAFYGKVFGFEGVPDSPMARPGFLPWRLAGRPGEIGCRITMGEGFPAHVPAHFTVSFLVAELAAAVRTATGLGGSVVVEPTETPGGPYAVLRDDQGATFGVMAPK